MTVISATLALMVIGYVNNAGFVQTFAVLRGLSVWEPEKACLLELCVFNDIADDVGVML